MEEAYDELYQKFLCLRSLCLRQARLLNQLTVALQKQQEHSVPNEEVCGMISATVQEKQENTQEKPELRSPEVHCPAAQCGIGGDSSHMGTFSDHLAMDMSQLHVDEVCQRPKRQETQAQDVTPAHSLESLGWQGASQKDSKNLLQADYPSRERTLLTLGMPVTDRPFMAGDFLCQSDGLLMSDVALQSHVCEFCQAVFPGDTTTRGEFLRHLYTHVT